MTYHALLRALSDLVFETEHEGQIKAIYMLRDLIIRLIEEGK